MNFLLKTSLLTAGLAWVLFSGCTTIAPGHDHHHHDHDQHDDNHDENQKEVHSEFHAHYHLSCKDTKSIKAIAFSYFDNFENSKVLEGQIITDTVAKSFELDLKSNSIQVK